MFPEIAMLSKLKDSPNPLSNAQLFRNGKLLWVKKVMFKLSFVITNILKNHESVKQWTWVNNISQSWWPNLVQRFCSWVNMTIICNMVMTAGSNCAVLIYLNFPDSFEYGSVLPLRNGEKKPFWDFLDKHTSQCRINSSITVLCWTGLGVTSNL